MAVLGISFFPSKALAVSNSISEDDIIEFSLALTEAQRTLYDMLYSLPPFKTETLDEYLKKFF